MLQLLWLMVRLRPNSVSSGSTDRQLLCTPQSPQPSHTSSLITTRSVGLHHRAALAAAALFGGAGLVVDDDRGAFDLAELALHRVQRVAVLDRRCRSGMPVTTSVFLRLVGHDDDLHRALGAHALRDLHHAVAFGPLAHLLAAGHGDRVVVEDLVGDVHARGDALANRQNAAVEVGAVAQVGEHVLVVAERLLPDPGHALAAHLGEAHGGAVHPDAS